MDIKNPFTGRSMMKSSEGCTITVTTLSNDKPQVTKLKFNSLDDDRAMAIAFRSLDKDFRNFWCKCLCD